MMSNCIGNIVLLATVTLAVMPASAATKVFLLGGQSNMAGLGGYEGDDPYCPDVPADMPCPSPYDQPQTDVNFRSEQTAGQWVSLQPGYGYHWTPGGKTFGPEVSFGYALHNAFPNDDIYLIKYGASGTNLAVDWNPNGTGATYNTFKGIVTTAIADLSSRGLNPQIAGMIWMQGESDAYESNPNADAHSAAYAANLTNFIAKVRSDFAAPDMQFVLGRITTYWGTSANNTLVRTAQETVPGQVGHAAWIDTDDLTWAYVGHYGTEGQITLGTRFADEFVHAPEPSAFMLCITGALMALAAFWRRIAG